MKGLENQQYLIALIISNVAAILLVAVAYKWPRVARFLFFLLFAWASWMNWTTAVQRPESYLEYGELAFSSMYRRIINGWFSSHITPVVGAIATCQALIALCMWLNNKILMAGLAGGILFLLAILPLGTGAGFPSGAIMAIALVLIWRRDDHRCLWERSRNKVVH